MAVLLGDPCDEIASSASVAWAAERLEQLRRHLDGVERDDGSGSAERAWLTFWKQVVGDEPVPPWREFLAPFEKTEEPKPTVH